MTAKAIPTLTGETFQAALGENGLALVEFYADWCTPCAMMEPILTALQQTLQDTVSIYRVDVEAEPALAERFGVETLPAVLLFRADEVVDRAVGPKSRRALLEMIEHQ